MKYLFSVIFAILTVVLSAAQPADTTATGEVPVEKLDFDAPNFIASNYFDAVKAHLSKEGRQAWRPEFSVRGNVMIYSGTVDLTGGIRTSPNKVFGLGVGYVSLYRDALPAHQNYISFYLHHRHYIPLDRRRRFSLYSDLMAGGKCLYKATGAYREDQPAPQKGELSWYFSWQPGLSIRLWGKSNLFFGPSLGPSLGLHLGLAL